MVLPFQRIDFGGPGRCPDPLAYFSRDESAMPLRSCIFCLTVWLVALFGCAGFAKAQPGISYHDGLSNKCRKVYQIIGNKAEIAPREVAPKTLYERHAQAGHPQCISPLADWSNTVKYWGYYVGGGNPHKCGGRLFAGEARRTRCEGTWGWDYVPFYSHVRLRWWHGRRYQDGEGQYEANYIVEPFSPEFGPKGIIPNGLVH